MAYPVLPPPPPPIVSFLQPEDFIRTAPAETRALHSSTASSRTLPATAPPEVLAVDSSANGNTDLAIASAEAIPSTRATQLGSPIEVSTDTPVFNWKTSPLPEVERLAQSQLSPSSPIPTWRRSGVPSTVFIQRLAQNSSSSSTETVAPTQGEATEAPSRAETQINPVETANPAETANPVTPPASPAETANPATPPSPAETASPTAPDIVELNADRQEYDSIHQVFTGIGHAQLRFRGGLLTADRIQANLQNRIAVGEGNARLTRGSQILEGDRFEYNFVQSEGFVLNARGEVLISRFANDFSTTQSPNDAPVTPENTGIYSPGGLNTIIGSSEGTAPPGGQVSRLRFEADRIDFTADGGQATNVRITNDPFSPPELELRANTATFTRLSPTRSEIRARNPRLVLDQSFTLPLLLNRVVIDNRQRDPSLVRFGYDQRDRGGFFVESPLELIATPGFQIQVRPQIFIQRALSDSSYRIKCNTDTHHSAREQSVNH
jgi:hypothetical protein